MDESGQEMARRLLRETWLMRHGKEECDVKRDGEGEYITKTVYKDWFATCEIAIYLPKRM